VTVWLPAVRTQRMRSPGDTVMFAGTKVRLCCVTTCSRPTSMEPVWKKMQCGSQK